MCCINHHTLLPFDRRDTLSNQLVCTRLRTLSANHFRVKSLVITNTPAWIKNIVNRNGLNLRGQNMNHTNPKCERSKSSFSHRNAVFLCANSAGWRTRSSSSTCVHHARRRRRQLAGACYFHVWMNNCTFRLRTEPCPSEPCPSNVTMTLAMTHSEKSAPTTVRGLALQA